MTKCTLALAFQCQRCFDISSLADIQTRSRGRCQRCGAVLEGLDALLTRYQAVQAVVVGGIGETAGDEV